MLECMRAREHYIFFSSCKLAIFGNAENNKKGKEKDVLVIYNEQILWS